VKQHAAIFFAQAEEAVGADLPRFVKDEFDAVLKCGILASDSIALRRGDIGHDMLAVAAAGTAGPSCGLDPEYVADQPRTWLRTCRCRVLAS
jgi:hypothetical protein